MALSLLLKQRLLPKLTVRFDHVSRSKRRYLWLCRCPLRSRRRSSLTGQSRFFITVVIAGCGGLLYGGQQTVVLKATNFARSGSGRWRSCCLGAWQPQNVLWISCTGCSRCCYIGLNTGTTWRSTAIDTVRGRSIGSRPSSYWGKYCKYWNNKNPSTNL